ncbi:hypothetical protein D3C72_1290400 [compost metagenome]
MSKIRVKRLVVGSPAPGMLLYDENTCKPQYAERLASKAFKVTLIDGNYDRSSHPYPEGRFEMETEVGEFSGYVDTQMPGLGLPEKIILTLIVE